MSVPPGSTAPLIDPDDFRSWILFEDDRLLVVNKPGLIVCHPSKQGPWSSLVGAVLAFGDRGLDPGRRARWFPPPKKGLADFIREIIIGLVIIVAVFVDRLREGKPT